MRENEPLPDEVHLLKGMVLSPLELHSPTSPNVITLVSEEAARVRRVACLVASSQDLLFYPPTYLTTPLDLAEESPELKIIVEDIDVNKVYFQVTATIPAYVWCGAFLKDSPPPSVTELKRHKHQFVRDQWRFVQTGLQPDSYHSLYCYGESLHACPMEQTIESTQADFRTEKGRVKVVDWLVNDNTLQFSLYSNLDKAAMCLLNGHKPTSQSGLVNHYYFPLFKANEYHLSCTIEYDSIEYSFRKTFGSLKEIKGFGTAYGGFTSFMGSMLKLVSIVLVILVAGAVVINNWSDIR